MPLRIPGGELHLLLHTLDGLGIWKWAGEDSTFVQWLVEKSAGVVVGYDGSRDGRRLALTRVDRSVQLLTWDGTRVQPTSKRLVHDRRPTGCRFDDSGERIVTVDGDRFAWVWKWDGDGTPIACVRSSDDRTLQRAWFTEDGREVVTVDGEQSIERSPIELAGVREQLARRWGLEDGSTR